MQDWKHFSRRFVLIDLFVVIYTLDTHVLMAMKGGIMGRKMNDER